MPENNFAQCDVSFDVVDKPTFFAQNRNEGYKI